MSCVIGIDIGGTKCAALLADAGQDDIKIIDREQIETKGKWQEVIDLLCDITIKQIGRNGLDINDFKGIGITCGGPLDGEKGLILSPPNLPGWDNVPIVKYVEEKLKIKACLKNDADAGALAEWKYGAGKGYNNVVFLTFGTGLGAGMIINGKLYTGTSNNAGELGHIRLSENGPVGYGKDGSFEGFCSGGGIKQLGQAAALKKIQQGKQVSFCKDISEINEITAKSIALAAENGDIDAIEVYKTAGRYFGKGLAILIDILNPEIIIAGGIYSRSSKLMNDEMYRILKEECLERSLNACRIASSLLGEKIGDYAAVVAALI